MGKLQLKDPAMPISIFTLTFPGGRIAVLEVRGAANQDRARTVAQHVLRYRRTYNAQGKLDWTVTEYSVSDGDATRGAVAPFYFWCCAEARTAQPHPRYRVSERRVLPC